MSQYYLMSQLPSLDGLGETSPLPITEKRFFLLCEEFLGKKGKKITSSLTLVPDRKVKKTGSKLVDGWYEGERELRLALAYVRATKQNKVFITNAPISSQLLTVAKTAVETEDPLSAEQYLNKIRLDRLESLRPMDGFCDEAVYYYGLKLKLISRIRQFDAELGQSAYQKIYSTVLAGE